MPISLILTPFDHFHFRPTSGLLSSQDLTYCLNLLIVKNLRILVIFVNKGILVIPRNIFNLVNLVVLRNLVIMMIIVNWVILVIAGKFMILVNLVNQMVLVIIVILGNLVVLVNLVN